MPDSLYLYFNNEMVSWYNLYKLFSLHFSTFKTAVTVQLTFLISDTEK
jgi:hypothetical protein